MSYLIVRAREAWRDIAGASSRRAQLSLAWLAARKNLATLGGNQVPTGTGMFDSKGEAFRPLTDLEIAGLGLTGCRGNLAGVRVPTDVSLYDLWRLKKVTFVPEYSVLASPRDIKSGAAVGDAVYISREEAARIGGETNFIMDVGATNIRLAAVHGPTGRIFQGAEVKTRWLKGLNNEQILRRIISFLKDHVERLAPPGNRLGALAIGIPISVMVKNGEKVAAQDASNISSESWMNYPIEAKLRALLKEAGFSGPLVIEADDFCAAWGETTAFGTIGKYQIPDKTMLALTLGTGVGSRFIVDGKVLYGDSQANSNLGNIEFLWISDYELPEELEVERTPLRVIDIISGTGLGTFAKEIAKKQFKQDPLGFIPFINWDNKDPGDEAQIIRSIDKIEGRAVAQALRSQRREERKLAHSLFVTLGHNLAQVIIALVRGETIGFESFIYTRKDIDEFRKRLSATSAFIIGGGLAERVEDSDSQPSNIILSAAQERLKGKGYSHLGLYLSPLAGKAQILGGNRLVYFEKLPELRRGQA